MDIGKICGVTFADAAGAFIVGAIVGAVIALLVAFWLSHGSPTHD